MAVRKLSPVMLAGCVVLLVMLGLWAKWRVPGDRAANDPTSATEAAAAAERGRTLIAALETYRSRHGFYPATLDGIAPTRQFLYSADPADRIITSDACQAREKTLRGWVMQSDDTYQADVARFAAECVTGLRNYQLQSDDFPSDPGTYRLERWAFYQSRTGQWTLGWCSHDGRRARTAMNGVCRR